MNTAAMKDRLRRLKAILVLAASIVAFRTRELFAPRKPLTLALPPFEKLELAPIRVREYPQISAADDEERVAARNLELHSRSAYLEPSRADAIRERLGLPIPSAIPPTMLEVAVEAKRQIDEANAERDAAKGEIIAAHLALTEAGVRALPNSTTLAERIRMLQADRATWESRYWIVKRERDTFVTLENKMRDLLWAEAPRGGTNRAVSYMPASTLEALRNMIDRFKRRAKRARSGPRPKRRK